MSVIDEIFSAADKRGLSLAEYVKHTYRGNKLNVLELNIKTQLSSLKEDISDFWQQEMEIQDVGENLMHISNEKLDLMQARVRENLKRKIDELDNFIEPESGEEKISSDPQQDLLEA
ncbi:MAG: hypothetical protein OEV21_02645 [Thermoplasmata archaeon]|nr:hypothetical protein [Thermoplasmata archaeon]